MTYRMFDDMNVLISTGSKAAEPLKGCRGGWLEFKCKYWNADDDDNRVKLYHSKETLTSTQKNQWEHKGRFSLFHDTRNKELKVVIRQLEQKDTGTYSCSCDSDETSSDEIHSMKVIAGKTCSFLLFLFLMHFFPK